MNVVVIGKGRNCPGPVWDLAYEVGAVLAGLGATVLTGGLGGVMDAAAKGAHTRGGTVIGLLPSDATSEPSQWLTHALQTGLPATVRNCVLMAAADAVVALPGSHGAVQELGLALDRGLPVWSVGDHGDSLTGRLGLPSVKVGELRETVLRWAFPVKEPQVT